MDIISPTAAVSASQLAKKVSMTEDEPALGAWITEVMETLRRPAGTVMVARHHVTMVQGQLSDMRENGGEIDLEQLRALIGILGEGVVMCRRLKPDAFALLTEVLIETKESDVRARGFYILAESLHKEAFETRDSFVNRLDLIGRGCLIQLYDQFVERTVAYSSRRWIGTLLLELIGESEENQQIIAMMSTSKRAKLGSAILYESSEIMRSISGRVMAVMLAAAHPAKHFFPPGTSEKLFKDYPGSNQPDSQWDKTFQEYVDQIWGDISAYNETGELQFAQNFATAPPHPELQSDAEPWHRSIYIELSDSVRVYKHSGDDHFSSAVDVPLASIEGIETTLTPVDCTQKISPVDVVLRIKPSTHCFINSVEASFGVVKLTVANQETADGIRDVIVLLLSDIAGTNILQSQVLAISPGGTDIQQDSQSRKSYGDDNLVLYGSYDQTVVDDSFVTAPAMASVVAGEPAGAEPHITPVREATAVVEEAQQPPLKRKKQVMSFQTDEVFAPEMDTARTAVELDIIKDVETGEVLSSKVFGMVVIPKVKRRPSIKAVRAVVEDLIEGAGNDNEVQPSSPQEETPVAIEKIVAPRVKKQALKSKAPIVAKRKEDKPSRPKEGAPQQAKASKLDRELQPSSSVEEVAAKKSKLVAPSKKHTTAGTKGPLEGNPAKQAAVIKVDDEGIYDVSSSPHKVGKNVKAQVKGKKDAVTTKSGRRYGNKSKVKNNLFVDEVDENTTAVKAPKMTKEAAKKKSLKQPVVPPATAIPLKRRTALRSTKGRKSMKDLSDSEIDDDELLVAEEPKTKQGSTSSVFKQGPVTVSKHGQEASRPVAANQASSIQATRPEAISKPKVAKTAVIGRPKVNEPVTKYDTPRGSPVGSPWAATALQMDEEGPFEDPVTITSIEQSDGLDRALPATAEVRGLAGIVEAKIGLKISEIFGFTVPHDQEDAPKKDSISKPARNAGITRKSGPPFETTSQMKEHVDDADAPRPLPVPNDDNEMAMDDDEFLVLSSPPKVTDNVPRAAAPKDNQHSSANDTIILSDTEDKEAEEDFAGHSPIRRPTAKRPILTPVVEGPTKRQRKTQAPIVSSSTQPKVVPLAQRAAFKANVHSPKPAIPVSGSSPYLTSGSKDGSSSDRSALVDDHQARKTPLIAFGPRGPRNQGLSSAVKPSRASRQEKPNTLSAIIDSLNKKYVEEPTAAQQSSNRGAASSARKPRVSTFEESLAGFTTVAMENQPDEDDGLAFFDGGHSVSSSRSHSRVDLNGSPKARRAPLAHIDGPAGASEARLKPDLALTSNTFRPRRSMAPTEKASSSATFEDDTTLFGSGLFISSNRKARPAAPEDDLDFESRYTPHHAALDGGYVGVSDQKVVAAAALIVDPFDKKVNRQDSDFARRLRLARNLKAQPEEKAEGPPTVRAQPLFQPPTKQTFIHSRLNSVVDADATLVDVENRPPQHRRQSRYYASSSNSSDSEAEACEEKYDSPSPDPRQIWTEALKPHQKDVSDVLHYVVDGLLQQLFDTEPAIYAIADEYRANGTKIVEGLKAKMEAETQTLRAHASSTYEELATSLRQSRAALQSESGASKSLDDQYKQWRSKQHSLQSLAFMAREVGGKR